MPFRSQHETYIDVCGSHTHPLNPLGLSRAISHQADYMPGRAYLLVVRTLDTPPWGRSCGVWAGPHYSDCLHLNRIS
jgi:hypothetical protein